MAHHPVPTCETCGKPLWPSWEMAHRIAKNARVKRAGRKAKRQPINEPYRCPTGNGWHLTSSRNNETPGRSIRRGR